MGISPLLMALLGGSMRQGGAQASPAPAPGQGNGLHLPQGIQGAAPQPPPVQASPYTNPYLAGLFTNLGSNQGFYAPSMTSMPMAPGLGSILGPLLGAIMQHAQPQQPGGGVSSLPGQRMAPPGAAAPRPTPTPPGLGGGFGKPIMHTGPVFPNRMM